MRFLIFILFFTIYFNGNSQNRDHSNLYLSLEYGYGALIPEYQFVNAIVEKNIQQIELSILKKTYGTNFWQKKYNYPQFGLSLFATSLGNKQVFGNEFALYPFVTFSSHPSKKFHLENKLGLGLGYATKRFELNENYQNIAVGSFINVHFNYQFSFVYELNSKIALKSSLNFHHFSNANMKEPNLGLNLVSSSIGLSKSISKQKTLLQPEYPIFNPKNEFLFILSLGGKHTRALQSDVFLTSSFAFDYNRKISHIFSFGVGLDGFYDSSTEVEMGINENSKFSKKDNFRTGLHISQEFVYNKFSFLLQEGIYIGLLDKVSESFFYNKVILRYKCTNFLALQAAVKSHLHILEFPEFGISYYF